MTTATLAIVQARTGSLRLPTKVLADIGGRSLLERVLRRVRRARRLDDVVVATTVKAADDEIARVCEALSVPVFRGAEEDVLDRYYQCARRFEPENIVRLTADNPLIDCAVIDIVVAAYQREGPDYASNFLDRADTPGRAFPHGQDVEVFSRQALERTWWQAREPYQRAHVTAYMYQHPEAFRLHGVASDRDHSAHRWTVDTPEDLEFVRQVYDRFANEDTFAWTEVLDLIEREPRLADINRHVRQKALEMG